MVTGTHILIANIVYKYILNKTHFKLEYMTFAYGNIVPDFDKNNFKFDHTVEGSLNIINKNAFELMKSHASIDEFSMALGVICHFVCDYFCLHHTKDYWKQDPLGHLIYEVSLHLNLLKCLIDRNLNISYKCKKEKDLMTMVMKLRKKYAKEPKGLMADINYSIIAATSICELIIGQRQNL